VILSETQVLLAAAVVSGIAFVGFTAWLTRIDRGVWHYCVPVVGVVGLASFAYVLRALGIGTVPLGDGQFQAIYALENATALAVLFATVVMLAGVSRRMIVAMATLAVVVRLSYEPANAGLVTGTGILLLVAVLVGGYGLAVYLLVKPVWHSAQSVPPRQRLIHWKARNLLLFMVLLLIVYGVVNLTGVIAEFEKNIVREHIQLVIRIGMAGFVFSNATDLSETPAVDVTEETVQATAD
jgi:hypothetical protein